MEVITVTKYQCAICGKAYDKKEDALSCESKPVTQDKGVKIGDIVLITAGQGADQKGKVTSVGIRDKYWGHYVWERYWHTVYIVADVIGSWGSRVLDFDNYEVIKVEDEPK